VFVGRNLQKHKKLVLRHSGKLCHHIPYNKYDQENNSQIFYLISNYNLDKGIPEALRLKMSREVDVISEQFVADCIRQQKVLDIAPYIKSSNKHLIQQLQYIPIAPRIAPGTAILETTIQNENKKSATRR